MEEVMKHTNIWKIVTVALALSIVPEALFANIDFNSRLTTRPPGLVNKPVVGTNVPGNLTEKLTLQATNYLTQTAKDTLDSVDEGVDMTKKVGATGAVMAGFNHSIVAQTVADQARYEKLIMEKNRIQNEIRQMLPPSKTGLQNTAGPDTVRSAYNENAHIGEVGRAAIKESKIGALLDPKGCSGKGCQQRKFEDNGKNPLGLPLSDLLRNGCNALDICDYMVEKIKNEQGKLLADVSPATKKNMAVLIAAGGGGDDRGNAIDTSAACDKKGKLDGSDGKFQEIILAGFIRADVNWSEGGDLPVGDVGKTAPGLQDRFNRNIDRAKIADGIGKQFNNNKNSLARVGGCPNQEQYKIGIQKTGREVPQGCASNNELNDKYSGSNNDLTANAARSEKPPQAVKGNDAERRARAAKDDNVGNTPGGGCAASGGQQDASNFDFPLLRNPRFLAFLESKEFLVAYIDAPKVGEGSLFDELNIQIANAWEKYEGNGAMMYANLMMDKPTTYAINATKFADSFNFKAFPYEKGNMLAHNYFDKWNAQATLLAEQKKQDEILANREEMVADNESATQKHNVYDMTSMTLEDLMHKVGVVMSPNGDVTVPVSITAPELSGTASKANDKSVQLNEMIPTLKATLVSANGL